MLRQLVPTILGYTRKASAVLGCAVLGWAEAARCEKVGACQSAWVIEPALVSLQAWQQASMLVLMLTALTCDFQDKSRDPLDCQLFFTLPAPAGVANVNRFALLDTNEFGIALCTTLRQQGHAPLGEEAMPWGQRRCTTNTRWSLQSAQVHIAVYAAECM